jgi:hypothetical protein
MRSIKVSDMSPRGFLAVDVADFISLLGDRALTSRWLVRVDWATGEGVARLAAISAAGTKIEGRELAEVLKNVVQVIDGRFEVFSEETEEPWAIVEAIDSSYFVLHADEGVLSKARTRFSTVSDYPNETTA